VVPVVAAEVVAAVVPAAAVPVAAEAAKAAAVVVAEAVEPVGVVAPAEAEAVVAPVEAAAALEVPEAVHHLLPKLRAPAQARKLRFSSSSTRISKFPAVNLTHSSVEHPFEILLLKPRLLHLIRYWLLVEPEKAASGSSGERHSPEWRFRRRPPLTSSPVLNTNSFRHSETTPTSLVSNYNGTPP
jgi:hypothetical protein